ncbi:ER lumen protein retaining receptor [Tieghemostelium lacteum]|uniref:ER lumen protein-retaining receptor n=1 Tax=Tieghemostelium lacteum TaxID=361077 RepID=A0A152A3Z0_TIELA|nr:ER lumen protein retaining receptor [Tieghemostelium lacteum]|eukprot:KYR00939.1 ER lumen protein retaining receptor [Tieghemostelium lacteum]
MNPFRLIGDMLHLISILLLLFKIKSDRSCAGISLKTQILFCVVFSTRYLDLFTSFIIISIYNTIMKVIYIYLSYSIVYYMMTKYKFTYDNEHDSFKIHYLIIPTALLAILTYETPHENTYFNIFLEILWTFSVYLESVAILPQLILLQRTGEVEAMTSNYIICLGGYRFFYFLNWIYRIIYEDWTGKIVMLAGIVQTLLYCDFFYYYFQSKWYGSKLVLPH